MANNDLLHADDQSSMGTGRCFLPPSFWADAHLTHYGQPVLINAPSDKASVYAEAWPCHHHSGKCCSRCKRLDIRTFYPVQPITDGLDSFVASLRLSMPWVAHSQQDFITPLEAQDCDVAVVYVGNPIVEAVRAIKCVLANAFISEGSVVSTRGRLPNFQSAKVSNIRVVKTQPPSSRNSPVRVTQATRITSIPFLPRVEGEVQTAEPLVAGLDKTHSDLIDIVSLPLLYPHLFHEMNVESVKGVLLHGPPGTGKTTLVRSVAAYCKAALVSVRGSELYATYLGESESNLRQVFHEAEAIAVSSPCILFIDEIDALCPRRAEAQTHENRVVAQLLTLMDGLRGRGQLIVLGATNRPNTIDPALRRSGRFDREVKIPVPSEAQRLEILKFCVREMPINPSVSLATLVSDTPGYTGADLKALCTEAGMCAIRRFRYKEEEDPVAMVTQADFRDALTVVVSSTKRGAQVKVGQIGWGDIGGLPDVKEQLRQSVEWPLLYPDTFSRLGLKSSKGVLLYGPPGCSKTTLVKAIASTCKATFLAVNGAQIYSPYVGDAELNLRNLFKRARAGSPSVVFLDEVEALVGRRGDSGSKNAGAQVQERVLSTLLNEMDGVESSSQVLVVAATNRPDVLDKAFLRPGRIDSILYIPAPDEDTRLDILKVKTAGIPLAPDVDLQHVAAETIRFSGADLEGLCREAALIALRADLTSTVVTNGHFAEALSVVLPSLTEDQIRFYEDFQSSL